MVTEVTIVEEPLASVDAQAVIGRLNVELTERYPNPEDRHFDLAEAQVSGGSGVYLLARLVAEGLCNHVIAQRLHLSSRTAENHVQHILNKLGFDSRSQIAAWFAAGQIE